MIALATGLLVIATLPQMAVCSFDPAEGIISNTGRPTPQFEATAKRWFKSGEPLIVKGVRYVQHGAPEKLYNHAFTAVTYKSGVPIFIKDKPAQGPDRIYVLVSSANCGFQPYIRAEAD